MADGGQKGPAAAGAPVRVLVVEDSATQAAALAVLLEDAGYAVAVARSGERALELVRRAGAPGAPEVDLVLSDVVMPGISGYEVCRRIKTELGRPDLPVVLVTSLTDPLDIVRGLESGADNYVTKPYDPERLLARLRAVLAARADRRAAAQGRPVTVTFQGVPFTIAADKEQIVELLVSSYEDLVRTSDAVRAAEQRARFLAEAGEMLSSSLEAEVILRYLARLAVPALADVCAVDLLDADGTPRRVEVVSADPARAARALADAPVAVPLVARGNTLGTLLLATAESGRRLGGDDLALATDLARRAALAVDNARLYREAQLATRARDDVLAIVSHDLRNPIHTIGMSAGFVAERLAAGAPPEAAELSSLLEVVQRAAGRANALIQDLLDVTRIEAGRLVVDARPAGARALLEEAAGEMGPLAERRGVRLSAAWAGPDAQVLADRGRVAQLFSNLVGNALKFTRAGGEVRLAGHADAGVAWFTVADTGRGIAADHLPHLFDRFWQADGRTRDGAGLGLSITRGIVEAHGGTIAVESVVGEGSTFRFSLRVVGGAGAA